MQTYICLLKGINVGGNNRIKMDDLKSLFKHLDLMNPRTYIQSGNIAFESNITTQKLQDLISEEIKTQFNLNIHAIIRSKDEWDLIIKNNLFINNHPIEHLHLTLLDHTPNQESIDKINEIDFTPDQFHLINKELFIVCNLKYSDTKLTNLFIEKNFKTKATTRNWKTVLAIQQLLG